MLEISIVISIKQLLIPPDRMDSLELLGLCQIVVTRGRVCQEEARTVCTSSCQPSTHHRSKYGWNLSAALRSFWQHGLNRNLPHCFKSKHRGGPLLFWKSQTMWNCHNLNDPKHSVCKVFATKCCAYMLHTTKWNFDLPVHQRGILLVCRRGPPLGAGKIEQEIWASTSLAQV